MKEIFCSLLHHPLYWF